MIGYVYSVLDHLEERFSWKQNKAVTSREKKKKNLLESVAIDKLWTSQQTLVFWKM